MWIASLLPLWIHGQIANPILHASTHFFLASTCTKPQKAGKYLMWEEGTWHTLWHLV